MTAFRPAHLSVSSVALFARCPAQWRRRYIDRLAEPSNPPMLFGKAFHAALEAEHRGQDSERALIDAWNAGDADLAASGQSMRPGKAHALALLNTYRSRGYGGAMGEPERMFKLPFPGGNIPVPLLGFIDAVTPDEIREYKTTGSSWWTETRAAMAPQTSVYGWAVQQMYRRRLPVRYVIFRTDIVDVTTFLVDPSPDAFRAFETEAEAVWRAIVAQDFAGCGKATCDACGVSKTANPTKGPTLTMDKTW